MTRWRWILHLSLGLAGIAAMVAGQAADVQIVMVIGGNLAVLAIFGTVHHIRADKGREFITLRGFRRAFFVVLGLCGFLTLGSGMEGVAASAMFLACYLGIGVLAFGHEVVSRPTPR